MTNEDSLLIWILAFIGAFGFGWTSRKMMETTEKVKTEICGENEEN